MPQTYPKVTQCRLRDSVFSKNQVQSSILGRKLEISGINCNTERTRPLDLDAAEPSRSDSPPKELGSCSFQNYHGDASLPNFIHNFAENPVRHAERDAERTRARLHNAIFCNYRAQISLFGRKTTVSLQRCDAGLLQQPTSDHSRRPL